MPSETEAKAAFLNGIAEGLTWGTLGKSLATGVASGIGAWCVTTLLDRLFGSGQESLEALFAQFRDEIVRELEAFIAEEVDRQLAEERFHNVVVAANAIATNFRTEVAIRDTRSLVTCWRESNTALGHAVVLHPRGFGIYFTVLDLQGVLVRELQRLPPDTAVDANTWWRGWEDSLTSALTRANSYVDQMQQELFEANNHRVTVGAHLGPFGEPLGGFHISVDGRSIGVAILDEADVEARRQAEVRRLNAEVQRNLLNPAREITSQLARLPRLVALPINTLPRDPTVS